MTGADLSHIERRMADYIADVGKRPVPDDVDRKTRLHILDTLVAIYLGRTLPAGKKAQAYADRFGLPGPARLIGTGARLPAPDAAMLHGIMAHADETDDSHLWGRFHPGAAILPAALAAADLFGPGHGSLIGAVALGYDIGARATMSLGLESPKTTKVSTHGFGSLYGSAAAAASMAGLTAEEAHHMLGYVAQQTSGLPSWNRDRDHIEKAFDFSGMGARNGVYAAMLAKAGMTGIPAPLTGPRGYLEAFAEKADPGILSDGLGERYEILVASIKKWSVGSPIQSILDALEVLLGEEDIPDAEVRSVHVTMPADRYHVVNDADMPAVCVQHLVAVMLLNGRMDFDLAHDEALMQDSRVQALRAKVTLSPDEALVHAKPPRQSIVEIEMTDGRILKHHAKAVRGTPDDPMTEAEVVAKARAHLPGRTDAQIDRLIAACLDGPDIDRDAVFDCLG